ncbi:hypothetical protein HOA55_04440 [archaeon]|jgi:hypothetical protein|nr:hypothetical protein [archaeon]MBT3577975.1 hypothetical protein [archaeon]MBT6820578.1 hypothetical protein [archaeon]MBT6956513.1 hypothetical protein [archaeon]MBT7025829.1 hypothetical protein [archaeon]
MKKEITIILAAVILLAIGLNITGFAVEDSDTIGVSVIRSPPIAGTGGTTYNLTIVSSENVVAIKESFIPEDCEVILTLPIDSVDIFEFNGNENTWIIADRAETFSFNMIYVIPLDCELDEAAGEVITLADNGDLSSGAFGSEVEADLSTTSSSSSGSSSGGSGGGSADSTSDLGSSSIRQTSSTEEFNQAVEEEKESIFSLGESKKLEMGSFTTILILVAVILVIVGFLAYSFLKKPKDFAGQTKAPMSSRK